MSNRRRGRPPARIVPLTVLIVLSGSALGGCGLGADGDLTDAQLVAKLDGHALSQDEVSDRLALADLLCGFDERILARVWAGLDAKQLEFQDYVFGVRCPERLDTYSAERADLGQVPEDRRLVLRVPDGIAPAPRPPASRPDWPGTPPATTDDDAGTTDDATTDADATPDGDGG